MFLQKTAEAKKLEAETARLAKEEEEKKVMEAKLAALMKERALAFAKMLQEEVAAAAALAKAEAFKQAELLIIKKLAAEKRAQ